MWLLLISPFLPQAARTQWCLHFFMQLKDRWLQYNSPADNCNLSFASSGLADPVMSIFLAMQLRIADYNSGQPTTDDSSALNIVLRIGIGIPSLRPGLPQGKFQGAERGVLMNSPKRTGNFRVEFAQWMNRCQVANRVIQSCSENEWAMQYL